MKTIIRMLLTGTLLFWGSQASAGEQEAKAWDMIDQGAAVIDVRTTEEYAQGHLKNALHIPFQGITEQLQRLAVPKDKPIVLYCRSGRRAEIAREQLTKAGYSQIHNGGGLGPMLEHRR